jgi:murein DD-endopeptidase MepM/ murein hydrolase activator NlpD
MIEFKHYRRYVVLGCVLGGLVLVGLLDRMGKSPDVRRPAAAVPAGPESVVTDAALAAEAKVTESVRTEQMTIRARSVIGDYLSPFEFSPQEIHRLIETVKPVYDLARIKAGQWLQFDLDPAGTLLGFRYIIDDDEFLAVTRKGDTWVARKEAFQYEWRYSFVEGRIESNLFEAVDRSGERPALAIEISEIFAWDVDFYADLRRGDSFRVLFRKRYLDGEWKGYGEILAAEFVNQGVRFRAVNYRFPDGRTDYFTPKGKSVRKELLKSPLKMGRVTSRFSTRRLHPVYKIYRPHYGVDIAAPVGTPVYAAGDGTVTFVGRKGQAGRMIEIRHPSEYTTQYLHLYRYAKGIRRGVKVRQAQLIGYVGSSGASTGPHLDYRIKYHGRHVNPLTQKFKPVKPLPEEYMADFRRWAITCLRVITTDDSLREYYLAALQTADQAKTGKTDSTATP